MSLEIYQAIVDTASAVGSLVAVCLAYKAFDVSRNISVRWETTPTVIFRSLPRQQERTRNL